MASNPLRGPRATRVGTVAGFALAAALGQPPALAEGRPTLQGLQDQVTALQRAVDCLNLPTVDVDVPVLAMGAYLPNGSPLASSIPFVGQFVDGATVRGPYRNYYTYDLRRLQPAPVLNAQDLVVGGELITYNKSATRDGVDGFRSDGTDTVSLVFNRVAWMSNEGVLALAAGTAGAGGYVDLADGPVYGDYVVSAALNGVQFNIRLSDMAVRDLNRANAGMVDREGRLLFAIGGTIVPLGGVTGNAYVFGGGSPYATLSLKVRRYQGSGCTMPSGTPYQ